MVKLRATHKTLRIVLFCVLGAIVAVAGTVGIIMLTKTLQPNIEPALTTNTKAEVPEGLTPEEAMEDEEESANTLYYLAYVLDSQECYSATAVNNSGSKSISLGSSETVTTKDYKDGVMISTDITSGLVPSYVQTCYVTGSDGSIIAYRRTGSLSNGEVVWNDNYTETYYYTRSDYITTYGEFSTEMTVYLINSDTIETCSEITDNGDGTYSQTFTFNSGAGNWYQYAMWTNGGLDGVPEFDSIQMTVTFDSSWRVLSISAEDETQVSKWSLPVTTASTTTTTFTYGEVNEENYSYYSSYFETAMQYATNGGSTVETDDDNVLSVLMDVFSDALGSDGDQFAVTLDIGGQKYYGYIYLKININASDILNDLDIRLTLSTDEDCDSQDLYVELKSGVVSAYYSSNFALNADISEMSSVISQFSNWISNYSYGTKDGNVQAASVKLTADDSGSFDLNSLLAAIKLTKNDDGTANITLDIEDLYGIDAYVQIDLTVTESTDEEGNTSTVYTFDGAYIGDISYNGNDVELKIDLAPTNTATISRNKSQTAFDLAEATSSLYAILNSTSIQADLDLDGAKLVTLVNSILGETDYTDYINLLSSYNISVSAIVDITGITTQASVVITDGSLTVIDLDVYYAYDGSSTYGIAYIAINNIMDVECAVKAYCDISDLADGINDIIDLAESLTGTAVAVTEDGGETGTESGTEEETDSSALIVAIINAVLGLDFSECITVTAQNKTITATLNADNVVDSIMSAIIGINMTLGMDLGEIALEYTYSTDESGNVLAGTLSLGADTLGIGLAVAGSTTAVTEPDSSKYLDLTTAVNSVYALLASESIQLDMKLTGSDLVTLLDDVTGNAYTDYINLIKGYTVDISAIVDITGITTQLSLVITDTDKVTVIDADIYYAYDGTSDYGIAYVSINKLMNVATDDAKVYCDIADLVDSIETIIDYFSNSISLAAEEQTTATSTVALIQSILALDFSEIIGTITTDTNKLTATVNADSLLALLVPNVKLTLGDIALDYNYEEVEGVVQAGELTLELTGISATLKASTTEVTEPDSSKYLDLTTAVNSVYALLSSESIQLDMILTGSDLVTLLDDVTGNAYTDYINLIKGYTVDVSAVVDITGITTQLSLIITRTSDKVTVIDADIYYAYDGTSDYGIAYVSINKLMDVATDDAKVYCDIADLVDSIETIIDYFSPKAQATADEQEETTATIVALIQSILALDFSEIIGTITTDTNKLTATVNADSLLALLIPNVKLTLGNIALDYSYETGEQGNATAGELTLNLTGISATITASDITVTPDDYTGYLDLTTIVASVYDLLSSESILLEMKLTGSDLVTLVTNLAGSSYAEYVALMEGYTADVKAYVDITGITTQLSLVITDTDNVTVIDADIYYEYDGTSKSYGTAYVSINKLMNVATDDAKVYCDIADLVDSIETIIDYFSPKAQATADEETTATTVALIQSILALDFSEIIGTITTDTNKLTATVNADSLLALLVPNVKLTLGNIALDYSYETDEQGNATAGELTLNLTGISATITASDTAVTPGDYTGYLDLTTIVASVYDLLASESIQLEMEIDGAQVVKIVNSATSSKYDTYLSILNDYDISIVANVNLDYMVQANVKITGTNLTVLDADIYYEYDGTSGSYGTAYIKVTTLMNVDCSVKGYCDIKDIASSINDIIKIVNGTTESAVSEDDDDDSDTLSTVALIGKILAIDYTKIVDSITIDASNGITASIDADAIVALFFSDITLGLGDVALDYNYNTDEQGNVTAGELSLGLTGITAVLTASTTAVTEPAGTGTYANLTYLANSIKNATSVAMDIATNGATFEISGAVEVNDSTISVDGCGEVVLLTTAKLDDNGEVVKKDGETVYVTTLKSVAVDVTLAVTNGIYGNDGTTANDITLQVVYLADNYTSTATDPFLYVIINGTGIAVTYSQYTSFTAEMTSVYETICALLGEETDEEDTGSGSDSGSDSVTITDSDVLAILEFITGAFANKDIMANISGITDLLNNFTITLDERGDISLVYTNADEETAATLKIAYITTTDGALTLVSDIADLSVNVSAYDSKTNLAGDLTEALTSDITTNLSGMIALVYGYVLQCVDDVDIKSVFGSDAYELAITLDGDASGIDALKGVTVDAAVTAGTVDSKNIYTIDADIVVSGFTVKLSMVYYNDYVYININDIGGTQFTDLSVKASTDDVYSLVKSVVELIMDEDVLSLVSSLITEESDGTTSGDTTGGETGTDTDADTGNTEANEALIALTSDDETAETTKSTLEAVLAMLTSMLKGNILTVNTGSDTVVVIDIDAILSPFGITAGAGKLYIDKVKDDNGNVTGFSAYMSNSSTSVETEDGTVTTLNKWLTLTATSATSGKYTKVESTATGSVSGTFYTGSYVDIGFASQLVDDIAKFAKDGIQTTTDEATGKKSVTRVEYTFTGDISVSVSVVGISTTIIISDIDITIGYTADGEFYLRVFGMVNENNLASISTNYIGISYSTSNKYISLASGLNPDGSSNSGTIYWIMTMDDFIDKLFATDSDDTDSPIRWLLNTGSNGIFWFFTGDTSVWNSILSLASLEGMTSSGLGSAENHYLYNTSSSSSSSIDIFGSDSYIASFIALLADGSTYSYGSTNNLVSTLGLDAYASSGYYGFSLGTGLLGDTLSPIYVGITCGTYGLSDIIAYASISSYLTVNASFEYKGSTEYTTKAADYFTMANDSLNDDVTIDWTYGSAKITKDNTDTYYYYKFGSVKIEGGEIHMYYNSYCLVDDYITVSLYEWNEADNCYSYTGEDITLRYGSTVYLYTLDGNGIVTSGDYAVVYTTDTYLNLTEGENYGTLNDGYSDDDLPTSVKVYSDTAIYEYVTTSTVYTVNIYNSTSNELLYTYNVFGTQDVTELYGDYTLISSLYSDSACTSAVNTANDVAALAGDETTLNLYGQFIESTVTINGVMYTFNATSETSVTFASTIEVNGINGGYYVVTGYKTSDIAAYYASDSWLVLENEINGYPVLEIAAGALAVSYDKDYDNSLKNVIVPENIVMIGLRAFLDNKTLEKVVFLADTVYFSSNYNNVTIYNSAGYDSTYDSKNYPFYGCTTQYSDTATNLVVYYTNAYSSNMSSGELNGGVFVVNRGDTYTRTTNYQNYTVVNSTYTVNSIPWTYLTAPSLQSIDTSSLTGTFTYTADQVLSDVNEVLQSASYGYNSALYASYGVYFYTSTLDTAAIAEALIAKINAYTETTYHYIDGYTVEVAISGYEEEDSYVITVTVKEATPYYKTSIAYATESASMVIGSISYAIDGETAYAEYNGAYYVQGGDVTVTVSPEGSYQLSSAEYNGNVYSGDVITENEDGSYSFTIAYESTADTITLNWTKIEENTITIYSDIAFTYGEYNAKPVSAGENCYTLGAKAAKAGATEDYMLGTLNADDGTGNYYFLGYAYMADTDEDGKGDTLTFTTISTSVFDSEGTIYYAIWGYNANSTLTVSTAASGTKLPTPTEVSSGAFYAWYTDEAFTSITDESTMQTGVYKYYARMQFTLSISITVSSSTFYLDGVSQGTSSPYTYTAPVYEGDTVSVTYSIGTYEYTIFWNTTTHYCTKATIAITHDGGTSSATIYAQKSDNNGDRYLYVTEYTGNWSSGISNSVKDYPIESDDCDSNAASVTINGDVSISYGA